MERLCPTTRPWGSAINRQPELPPRSHSFRFASLNTIERSTLPLESRMRISSPRKQAWPFAISNIADHAKFYSRSQDAVIRVYDEAGNVIETHEHNGDFKEW